AHGAVRDLDQHLVVGGLRDGHPLQLDFPPAGNNGLPELPGHDPRLLRFRFPMPTADAAGAWHSPRAPGSAGGYRSSFSACSTVAPPCTTAATAATMRRGSSCCQMLRPIATPRAPPSSASLTAVKSARSSPAFSPPKTRTGTGVLPATVRMPAGAPGENVLTSGAPSSAATRAPAATASAVRISGPAAHPPGMGSTMKGRPARRASAARNPAAPAKSSPGLAANGYSMHLMP